jgi:hypothetical protein
MKLWVDEMQDAPDGYVGAHTVTHARVYLMDSACREQIELIDLGDDAIQATSSRLLEWLEEKGRNRFKIHLHGVSTANRKSLREIISRNGWEEV